MQFSDALCYIFVVCGEDFYQSSDNQCSRCPENSVRPLNESVSMCLCENGYSRRLEDEINQPCIRKLKSFSDSLTPSIYLSLSLSYTHTAYLGFTTASVTFQEMNVPSRVSIPLYLSATSSREVTVTFTVTPSMYMSLVGDQVVFPPGTTMQVRRPLSYQVQSVLISRVSVVE